MTIPLKFVTLICVFFIALVWWLFTRQYDFLADPSAERLSLIRKDTLASLSKPKFPSNAIAAQIPFDPTNPSENTAATTVTPINLGDLSKPLELDDYANRAAEGSDRLFLLAEALEAKEEPQRALLAYERIIDSTQAKPEQIVKACAAILRLKALFPNWDNQLQENVITIQIGTGKAFADELPEILNKLNEKLSQASSGVLKFNHQLHLSQTTTISPVAVWLSGSNQALPSTEAISFVAEDPEHFLKEASSSLFKIIRNHLAEHTSYHPIPEASENLNVAYRSYITRLLWYQLGESLNPEITQN